MPESRFCVLARGGVVFAVSCALTAQCIVSGLNQQRVKLLSARKRALTCACDSW